MKEITNIGLDELGYGECIGSGQKSSVPAEHRIARVVAEHKEAYRVRSASGERIAKMTGKQIFDAVSREDYPAVGDWVVIAELDSEKAVIQGILPRKTVLKKKYNDRQDVQIIGTNIDTAFVVESLDRDYNLNRFERYLVLANEGGIRPVIVLSKVDLVSETELNERIAEIQKRFDGVDVIPTSTVTEHGFEKLMNSIAKGKTYCFLGSSGVGKSSLINRLLNSDAIRTGAMGDAASRGKHTTTTREMYFLENGGIVIDNPGTREVGIAAADAGIENVFDEISRLSEGCRYADCAHIHEPECAVLKAIEEKRLDEDRYRNYLRLKKENEYYELTDLGKREKGRKFGKFMKKALKRLKEIEP
ncbi:MAG: ribosome small subunit-dependent GTPase A [Candidatus Moranbacteria bacterium]|nr:ribosome small subunit-dependent GTPase A [Candidatus Moranbacteria bacterium]